MRIGVSVVSGMHSSSLLKRRLSDSQANVRSTIQRLGRSKGRKGGEFYFTNDLRWVEAGGCPEHRTHHEEELFTMS